MKTIRFILISITILTGSHSLLAQVGQGIQRINNAKIGMITNRLNLTQDQATQFWPIYNEYDIKQIEIRKNIRRTANEINTLTATDTQILEALRKQIDWKQKEVDLEREYMSKFLKVLNARQLAELYKAELQFTQMLLKQLNKDNKQD
jgi:Spy/CpxP family protein refolding chaperone